MPELNAFEAPAEASTRDTPRLVGALTCFYATVFGGCCSPVAGLSLLAPMTTSSRVIMIVCTMLYWAALLPGIAGLCRARSFPTLYVAWAVALILAELASVGLFVVNDGGDVLFSLVQLPLFITWPVMGLVWLLVDQGRA